MPPCKMVRQEQHLANMSSRYSTNGAHQRELRTQLFSQPTNRNTGSPPLRSGSPYDKTVSNSAKYNESMMSTLESQNDDELGSMSQKVAALRNLGVRMGSEINKGIALNDDITNSMEKGKVTLKNTFNQMIVMSQRAGISWRVWLLFFALVFLWFFYVWIF
ncbi:hypothetical protein PGUG_02130 [Meyerozyma guilliermondii ATCC 6260]|uniref:t-SNARE coiled-coil homology domain-containing protein n=1 Tax=Meyerozyma guilliermondii (strain ATCC 6260 / CBS 566 / DSM 6381 / JCM 1539 / NBRC 10279 / NRRL Y-324) TaxID=294746 RepID=A5DFS9_PICGU|nr:uncharacterized protein PGUG_02130 [Meyerozyma guilliermondii ATCC 6260]EDK38032.2 hypothetical protein PGUG_02130 [Meyerozyma guilliermondii ATCC 6260]